MSGDQLCYLAYMLRVWQVSDDGELTWRASLENPPTGERRGFASPEMLFEFLREQICGEIREQDGRRSNNRAGQ
jgi:hypothetical protein